MTPMREKRGKNQTESTTTTKKRQVAKKLGSPECQRGREGHSLKEL
jgi:hypothetical protein